MSTRTARPASGPASSPAARCHALVPCAGTGSRAGTAIPKQYVHLAGRSLVAHTLQALGRVPALSAVWVILSPDDEGFEGAVPPGLAESARVRVARCGGATRAETVAAGLSAMLEAGAAPDDWVLVHDAARCLVRPVWIERLIEACRDDPVGGLLAQPLADTLKQEADPGGPVARVACTVDRQRKWLAQTPQMFRIGTLQAALASAGPQVTDEASAIEAAGASPMLVPAPMENFKLTWPADFELAERLLRTAPHPEEGKR